jgi:hypothetical protein
MSYALKLFSMVSLFNEAYIKLAKLALGVYSLLINKFQILMHTSFFFFLT